MEEEHEGAFSELSRVDVGHIDVGFGHGINQFSSHHLVKLELLWQPLSIEALLTDVDSMPSLFVLGQRSDGETKLVGLTARLVPLDFAVLVRGHYLDHVVAFSEELSDLNHASVVVATLLPQKAFVVLIEVFGVHSGLMSAGDFVESGISLKSLRNFNINHDQGWLCQVEFDVARLQDLSDSVLVAKLKSVACKSVVEADRVEVDRQRGQVAELNLLHDPTEGLSRTTEFSLLKQHVESKPEQLPSPLGLVVRLEIRMDDQLILSLGQSDWTERIDILA